MKIIRRVEIIFWSLAPILLILASFFNASAQSNNSVTVGMTVDSRVSLANSSVSLSANEVLADPENHPIVVIVKLRDASNNIMPNITVEISSNRGNIDIIEMFESNGQTLLPVSSGKTDENGEIRFRLGSYVPGDVLFSIVADTLVHFPDQKVKFLPLPFPGNIEVSVAIPGAAGSKITLIPKSAEAQASTTPARIEARRLANIGTEITIPFSLFVLVILILISAPILILFVLLFLTRLKKQQKKELELLNIIAEAEHVDQVKHFVSRNQP